MAASSAAGVGLVGVDSGAGGGGPDEDEDDLLYGDSAPSLFNEAAAAAATAAKPSKPVPTWVKFLKPAKATYWAVGLRDNGNLEVMTLPDFTLRYVVPHFPLLPNVLACAPKESWSKDPPAKAYPEGTPSVAEILMVGLGGVGNGRRPLLIAR